MAVITGGGAIAVIVGAGAGLAAGIDIIEGMNGTGLLQPCGEDVAVRRFPTDG